ncbi:hypothetical protein HOO14_08160 [bacterium]|jgi:hypothetical protein|nr:hypothetical protein [bacterium]
MDNKKIEYDDVTLMQYADGELHNSEYLQLKKDLESNKDLQDRLAVFAMTRDDLIGTKVKLPKHIEDLIDEQDIISNDKKITRLPPSVKHSDSTTSVAIEQDNMVVGFFKNYPVQSLAASVMFGLLIGSQGMKNLYTNPYGDMLINGPVNEYQSASKEDEFIVEVATQTKQPITRGLPPRIKDNSRNIASKLLEALNKDIKNISTSKGIQTIKIVSKFKNANNYQCKLTEIGERYLVACKNKSGNWSIHQTK